MSNDPDKMRGDFKREEHVEPETEIDYQSPDGRIRITVERRRYPGGREENPHTEESYTVFFNERLIGGADNAEACKEMAIEAMETMLGRIHKFAELGLMDSGDSPRNQAQKTEPADKLEAAQTLTEYFSNKLGEVVFGEIER